MSNRKDREKELNKAREDAAKLSEKSAEELKAAFGSVRNVLGQPANKEVNDLLKQVGDEVALDLEAAMPSVPRHDPSKANPPKKSITPKTHPSPAADPDSGKKPSLQDEPLKAKIIDAASEEMDAEDLFILTQTLSEPEKTEEEILEEDIAADAVAADEEISNLEAEIAREADSSPEEELDDLVAESNRFQAAKRSAKEVSSHTRPMLAETARVASARERLEKAQENSQKAREVYWDALYKHTGNNRERAKALWNTSKNMPSDILRLRKNCMYKWQLVKAAEKNFQSAKNNAIAETVIGRPLTREIAKPPVAESAPGIIRQIIDWILKALRIVPQQAEPKAVTTKNGVDEGRQQRRENLEVAEELDRRQGQQAQPAVPPIEVADNSAVDDLATELEDVSLDEPGNSGLKR